MTVAWAEGNLVRTVLTEPSLEITHSTSSEVFIAVFSMETYPTWSTVNFNYDKLVKSSIRLVLRFIIATR